MWNIIHVVVPMTNYLVVVLFKDNILNIVFFILLKQIDLI